METLTKTQLSLLFSYSMPFVFLSALVINGLLLQSGFSGTFYKLVFLSAAFPIGFSIGRAIYYRWSHVQINFDSKTFAVIKGTKEIINDFWRNYKFVSIALDRYGRPNLRLYKTVPGDHVELPISKTDVQPQEFRDRVQLMISPQRVHQVTPQFVEAA